MTTDADHRTKQRLKGLMAFRVLLVTVFFGAAIAININTFSELSSTRSSVSIGLIISTYALTILYATLIDRVSSLVGFARTQLTVDVVLSALLVVTTGGLRESIFVFTLYLPIIGSAILVGRQVALRSATSVGFILLYLILVSLGAIPSPHPLVDITTSAAPRALLVEGGANIVFAYLLAWVSGQLAQQIGEAREEIERAQFDIAELRALNADILASLSSGLLTLDEEHRIIFFNQAAEEITMLERDAIFGKPLEEIFPKFAARLVSLDTSETRERRFEDVFLRSDGRSLFLGFSVSALRARQGSARGKIIIFQDLTHIRALEEHARRTEQLAVVGQLAASMAHEIRNPLASISGSVEMLQEMKTEDEDERMLMDIVTREVHRLDSLISQFLDYSRPRTLHITATHLGALLEEVLRLFRAGAEGVAIMLELDEELREVRLKLDAEAVRQIVWNLLNNASEAMQQDSSLEPPPQGAMVEPSRRISGSFPSAQVLTQGNYPRIDIQVHKDTRDGDPVIRLDVEDNGPGISGEVAERIFEPFFTTKTHGTGLGLATIFRLVEQHGGSIRVRAPEVLRGARFSVELPYVVASERARPQQAQGA